MKYQSATLSLADVELSFGDGKMLPASIDRFAKPVTTETSVTIEMTVEGDAMMHFLGFKGDDPQTMRDLEGKWLW